MIEAECIDIAPKVQNSFYQNIFISDMKKDIDISQEEINKYRLHITELQAQIDNLTQDNEYLAKLVKKYRIMVPDSQIKDQSISISQHSKKVEKSQFLQHKSGEFGNHSVVNSKDLEKNY